MKKRGILKLILPIILSALIALNTPLIILAEGTQEEVAESQEESAGASEEAEPSDPAPETPAAEEPSDPAPAAPAAEEPSDPAPATPAVGALADPAPVISSTGASSDPASGTRREDPSNIDAEKYSIYEEYDSLLCWAATAANMLWLSNTAQQAVNPLTGERFGSEDEVFDYFRRTFTDETGWMDGAIFYFTDNYYKYSNVEDAPQIKPDAPRGGLIEGGLKKGSYHEVEPPQEKAFDVLGDIVKKGVGLGVRFWDTSRRVFVGGHAITLIDLVKGNDGRYKGIWVADSDNDTPYGKGLRGDTDLEKMALAAYMPNAYTYYRLSFEEIDGSLHWVMEDYMSSDIYKTVIQLICWLNEMEPEDPEEPEDNKDDDDDKDEDNNNDVYSDIDFLEYMDDMDQEAQIEYLYSLLKSMMYENKIVIMEMSPENSLDPGMKRSFVVRRVMTSLLNVSVDGQRLSGNGEYYTVTKNPEGLFTITLMEGFIRTLDPGHHTLTLNFGPGDDVSIDFAVN